MSLKVGEVAALAHVSVRTLHHYDEIGLLAPSERSAAGYRLYSDGDLERLQHILLYREVGFELDRIAELLADPSHDRVAALREQRDLIAARAARLEAVVELIDKTIAAQEGGIVMTKEEMFEVFGDFDPEQHREEAEQRWGDTDAYRESARRAARYTKQDWQRFKAENDAINGEIMSLMEQGVAPDDPRAMDAVERARLLIDEWFYPCSRQMHASLGEMYIADERFTATYEKMRPGMAAYVHAAIMANAKR